MSQLIEVQDFPAVIQADAVQQLRSDRNRVAQANFARSYLGFDEHSCFALSTLIESMSRSDRGGAFFINGVFGSGKSHLLGLLTLLGEGLGREDFLSVHTNFKHALEQIPPRMVVYFSLDEYDGTRFALEEITWREIERQAKHCGIDVQGFTRTPHMSRSEQFIILEEALHAHGYAGLQLCVDELSLFLGAKDHPSLQAEASWLQFLGQRSQRTADFSLWCCFALQKEWEDVGDIEAYSLAQVRDRYQTLTLSMAHLPSLVQHRLVRRTNTDAIHQICQKSFVEWNGEWPELEFGIAEWEALYPFHPSAIELLEQVSSRFFSRTRSAVLYCTDALKRYVKQEDATAERIGASNVFDYFKNEFSQYVELKPFDLVWRLWKEAVPRIARDKNESILYTKILKALLLFRLSGHASSAIQIGNTLDEFPGLGGEKNYRHVHQLLCKWCKEGDQLTLERGNDWRGDRFYVTLGQSVQQTVRRHTRRVLETLSRDDARIVSHLLEVCDNKEFPLNSLVQHPVRCMVDWQHSSRRVEVALWQHNTPAQLVNQLASWGQNGAPEVFLFLAMPLQQVEIPTSAEMDTRLRTTLLLWQPRLPTSEEWEFARETTARALLLHDPALRDNRRGRAVIKYLEKDLSERHRDIQYLMVKLYCEGCLTCGDNRSIEINEISHQHNWNTLITSFAAFSLDHVYKNFSYISPKVKLSSPSQVKQLCMRMLKQNGKDCWWPASLDRPVRSLAVPLGLAGEDKGRWKHSLPREELSAEIEALLDEKILPVAVIEEYLVSSLWGMLPSQVALVICGLLGAGKLEAVDANGKVLSLQQIRLPLQETVAGVRLTSLIDEFAWEKVNDILNLLCGKTMQTLDFASQMDAAECLREWSGTAQVEIELANSRLYQLQKSTDNAPVLWQQTARTITDVAALQAAFRVGGTVPLLQAAVALDQASVTTIWRNWQHLQQALDRNQRRIIPLLNRLSHPQLSPPLQLKSSLELLKTAFLQGEKVLFDESLLVKAWQWDEDYQVQYRNWHQQQYTGEHWETLRALFHGFPVLALQQLQKIPRYPFQEDLQLPAYLQAALNRQCSREGRLMESEVCCNHCRLRFGQDVDLPNLEEVSVSLDDAMQHLYDFLQKQQIKSYLQREESGRSLLKWNGGGEELLPLLDEATLLLLEKAMQPRRSYHRSVKFLTRNLGSGGTRRELESTFRNWLEEGNAVGAEDEITIEE